jgi:hypothetical protein
MLENMGFGPDVERLWPALSCGQISPPQSVEALHRLEILEHPCATRGLDKGLCSEGPDILHHALEQLHEQVEMLVDVAPKSVACGEGELIVACTSVAVSIGKHEAELCEMADLCGLRFEVRVPWIFSNDLGEGQWSKLGQVLV